MTRQQKFFWVFLLLFSGCIYAQIGYVGNQDGSNATILIIDTDLNAVTGVASDPLSLVNAPVNMAITPNGKKVYVVDTDGAHNVVYVVDTTLNTVTQKVNDTLSPFTAPNCAAVSPDGTKAYVTNTPNAVRIINTATDVVTGNVTDSGNTFDFGNQPDEQIAFTPDGTKAYAVNFNTNSVSVIDVATDTVSGIVTTGGNTFAGPRSIAITPDGTKAYVVNDNIAAGKNVSIIDVATDTVIGYVDNNGLIGPFEEFQLVAMSPDGKHAYIYSESAQMWVIDVATDTVTAEVSNPDSALQSVVSLAITMDSKRLLAVNNDTFGPIENVNLVTNAVSGTVSDSDSVISFPFPIVLGNPTVSVSGCKKTNTFLTQREYFNVISWYPAPSPLSYAIYRDAALTDLAGTVPANTLQFIDHNRSRNITYEYYVVAVYAFNNVLVGSVMVTQSCASNNKCSCS